jgi:hypothetical protein
MLAGKKQENLSQPKGYLSVWTGKAFLFGHSDVRAGGTILNDTAQGRMTGLIGISTGGSYQREEKVS